MNILEFDVRSDYAKTDRDKAVRDYLTSNGWKYTSRHPGHLWLWSYTDESRQEGDDETIVTLDTYAVEEATALQIQRYWELQIQGFNTHADDCPIFTTFKWEDCTCMESKGTPEEAMGT